MKSLQCDRKNLLRFYWQIMKIFKHNKFIKFNAL